MNYIIDTGIKAGQYQLITKAAREVWKNFGNDKSSIEILFSQMRKYKLKLPPYDMEYIPENDTPKIWWLAIDDTNKSLQNLALIMINITPHSTSCERIFSTLGWIYGKKRLRLSVKKLEGMAKVRSYYMSALTDELKHIGKNVEPEELKSMVEEALEDGDEDSNEDDNEEDEEEDDGMDLPLENEERLEIPNHDVFVVVENIFDLERIPYILDSNDIEDDESSSSDNDLHIDYNELDNENYLE